MQQVIFYGAGRMAHHLAAVYAEKNIVPVCFCDRDVKKHGRQINGINIISPEEAFAKYKDMPVLVTPKSPLKLDIINSLEHEYGIAKHLIINYEPYARHMGCEFLQHYAVMGGQGMQVCCASVFKHKSPAVPYAATPEASLATFLAMRQNLIAEIKNGNSDNSPCAKCLGLKERLYSLTSPIRELNFSLTRSCNFNCLYCFSASKSFANFSKQKKLEFDEIKPQAFIEAIERLASANEETIIDFASGEITAQKDCDEILNALVGSKYAINIFTNASIFSKKIAYGFRRGQISLIVSIDCGTRATFNAIKGVDMFDAVRANLKKYSEAGVLIQMKYILMHTINDNDEQIDGFLELCQEIKPFNILLTRDIGAGKITDSEKRAVARLANAARDNGFDIEIGEMDITPA